MRRDRSFPFYHRLRWRLIGAPLTGVLVGATTMVVATYFFAFQIAPELLREELTALLADPSRLSLTESIVLANFQRTVFVSIAFAAGGAVLAGVVYSVVLWRSLVSPLRQMAQSSQRIADGRYGERVDTPGNVGEALTRLVTNFNQMAEALEHIEEKRRNLIGNVTHELRTPLTSLRGFIEGLEDGLFPPSEETFKIMAGEIARLSRLIEDIQTLSRVEAGAIHLEIQEIDLADQASKVVRRFQPQALLQNVTLELDPAAVGAPALGDRDRIDQILTNLIANALRYTPEEGEIILKTGRLDEKGMAFVAVCDSGVGIPADGLPFVFERFYRVDGSRSRESGGSGVGLTISRHLAWMMGGDLSVQSDGEGEGATFTLTLPGKTPGLL